MVNRRIFGHTAYKIRIDIMRRIRLLSSILKRGVGNPRDAKSSTEFMLFLRILALS